MAASVYDNIIHLLASLLKGQINRFTKKQNFSLTVLSLRFLFPFSKYSGGEWNVVLVVLTTLKNYT